MVFLMFNDKNFENFVKASLEVMCVWDSGRPDGGVRVVVCDTEGYKNRRKTHPSKQEAYVVVARDSSPMSLPPDAVLVRYPLSLVGLREAVAKAEKIAYDVKQDSGYYRVTYDRERRVVSYCGEEAGLSPKEGLLFEALFERSGEPVSRDYLREYVFGPDVNKSSNVVDVYVNYLRKRLNPLLGDGAVAAVRGVGYSLRI